MCLGPFVEPVSVKPLGNTYCKDCITAWLSENRTDPLTGTRLTIRRDAAHPQGNIVAVLVPNLAVQQIIDAQSVPCRYAARGCEACPALGDLEAHEANCPCKPSKCARCAFVGSRLEVAAHEQACPFVVLGPVLDAQDARETQMAPLGNCIKRMVLEPVAYNDVLGAGIDAEAAVAHALAESIE